MDAVEPRGDEPAEQAPEEATAPRLLRSPRTPDPGREARWAAWTEENGAAIEAWNAWYEANGHPLAEYMLPMNGAV